ncbi:hypothetical protein SASPL_142483 [Salvia splendens]|uniref:FAD-binding PCMH-type domain-containing protein n=1 Tax=Salvia splendens TaxID=180675 RepID=A0A8X8WKR6_SALSN|nr:hypothetical protein SASPL_142483 [Salvia splendens]
MKNLPTNILFPLIIFMQILAHAYCHESVEVLQSCLVDHSVFNFSLYPNSGNDPTTYFSLLDFSIQNLRFAVAETPKPAAIIMPESRQQLVAAVVCCRLGSWEIRVRSGGHSYEGASYMAGDGRMFVLIDMMNLDGVSVDSEAEVAWVEGGATLGQTYYAISRSSLSIGFPAGSCPTVRVGGHVGGGGFGLLSRMYGLAADNAVDALLIDTEGRVLDRAGMGEDVFWAIRGGGGGNWGIVYAWKIRLVKVPERVTGFIVNRARSEGSMLDLVNRWQYVAPGLDDRFYLSSFLGASLPEAKASGLTATFKGFGCRDVKTMKIGLSKEKKAASARAASESLRLECVYQYKPHEAHICQVKPAFGSENLLNICEAVQLDGSSILEVGSKRKSVAMAC